MFGALKWNAPVEKPVSHSISKCIVNKQCVTSQRQSSTYPSPRQLYAIEWAGGVKTYPVKKKDVHPKSCVFDHAPAARSYTQRSEWGLLS